MITQHTKAASATTAAVDETPWYDLIDDPEPPEDAMQQADTIFYVMSILQARYGNDPNTLWSEQSNIVYDSEIRGSVVAPDGYVVFGVDARAIRRDRRSYRIDEWGEPPAFVLEVASESTATRDLTEKREIYARMGAREYWRLDKRTEYYGEPLVGERLVDGEYRRCELHVEANGDIWSRSEALGVDFFFRIEDGEGRFLLRDSITGKWLHNLPEEIAAHAGTEVARQAEAVARQAAEARAQATEAARQAEAVARQAAEAEAQAAEEARQAEEVARQEAEARAQTTEAARQEAEARAQTTEAARQAEEVARQAAEARAQTTEAARQASEEARLASEARNRELMAELERLRRRQ